MGQDMAGPGPGPAPGAAGINGSAWDGYLPQQSFII